jgi:hypothetical protein
MQRGNQNTTPRVGHGHLCVRCSWGQSMTGYRESDHLVICTYSNLNLTVPFPILNCTSFEDRCRPSWMEMQRLAIDLRRMQVTTRTVGFGRTREARPSVRHRQDPDTTEDEAALFRWLAESLAEDPSSDPVRGGYIW